MTTEGRLEVLGLKEKEEALYRAILRSPGASAPDLKRSIPSISDREFRTAVAALEEKGLVSRSPGPARSFVPSPPDLAIEALAHRRQEELNRARALGRELFEELKSRSERKGPQDIVDVVRGHEAVLQRWHQLQRAANHEVLAFDAPPYADLGENTVEVELLERGVTYRVVYATGGLEIPVHLRHMLSIVSAGEEARVLQDVPMKLDIADHTLAMAPLELEEPGVESALVIRASPLLEALRALFEALWERAVPVGPGKVPAEYRDPPAEPDRRLLTLLAVGFQDQAIAHQLGCSLSTVRRRVASVMRQVGAETRFQMGLQAAERGWLRSPSKPAPEKA